MKAVGIARQSKGDEKSQSIEAQTAEIRDYCAAKGFPVSQKRTDE
jgi:DNA invertase Pin-like site-specific DNA recombinase